jgi:cytochrome c-type biogenesis protein CcmE
MKARHRRFLWIGTGVALLGVAAALVLNAFQSNLVFFFTPSQIAANEAPQGARSGSAAWWSKKA